MKESDVSKKISMFNEHIEIISYKDLTDNYNFRLPNLFDYKDKYLYIFKNEIGKIKIGQAVDVEKRLKAIKMQAGLEIQLINKIKGFADYEKKLHKLFKDKKYIGEWFDLNETEISWLSELNKNNIEKEYNYILKK
jgi:dsDNA-specific endonuclease/ATPase MutS2